METSLLATKLFVPPARPGLVPRPRLMERLQTALTCRLTLVSAQAGYGKSTVLTQWISENRPPGGAAWLSLDEGDNDPVRFWDYFIAALRTLRPTTGETALALLRSPQPYPTESVLTALINDLANESSDYVVVLDDYHLIKAEAVHAGVTFLLDHLPPKMHLVIATRADPHLPLAHLRGRGQMEEIGADDLRFTAEETADLLKRIQGPALSGEDIAALNARTEGWAVGLTMAALSMGKRKDVQGFIATFTGSQRHVMDYLMEELLKQQPAEIRDFLLQTSILERLSGPLCDAVTGRSRSQETLIELESSFGGFLVPLDESRQWYRYHHLLAELLRHQLERVSEADKVTQLHRRASRWYEDNKFPDDAIHHALVPGDSEKAMRLIYAQSEERIRRGEMRTLLNWLQLIPDEILHTHPRLYSQYGNVLVTAGQFDAAEAALSYLEQTAQGDANLQGEVAVSQATLARRRGDISLAIELAEKSLSLLSPDNLPTRARASLVLGFVVRDDPGLFEKAWSRLTDAYDMARRVADYWVAASAASYLAQILWLRGKLNASAQLSREAIDLAGLSPAASWPR